jgi:hypothetical protein
VKIKSKMAGEIHWETLIEMKRKSLSEMCDAPMSSIGCVIEGEAYLFFYDYASSAEALRTFGRYASNPELNFTDYDAGIFSQKLRQEAEKDGAEFGENKLNLKNRFGGKI